jgi:hypothetical protein
MAVALVGRGTEQAELTSTWQAARGGQARVVGLTGPAGIGKTALVAQFLRDSAPPRPVWVSGAPEERTLSWGVLGQAVPALAPDLRPAPPPVWSAPDPEADPLYVGQSFLDDLRAAGETVLVLDDAHWADRQSQAALRFAARHMTGLPVLVIVIYNDEAPLDESWRRLFGSAHGSLITLAGLTPEELVRLAVARGYFGLSPAAAARLHEHTGGNPLYASALLAQLPARDLAAGPLPAPRSLVETVAANLARRSEPAVALLSAAAVLGRSFDVAQATALAGSLAGSSTGPSTGPSTGSSAGTAAAVLDEAVAAGLAEEVPGTAGRRFAFSHALVHQAVYTRIALARRRELHRQAGALLGEAEALRHRVAAADGPDPELAADLDRQAALDTVRGELAAASGHLQDALRLTPPGPARAPRLLAVVEAELIAGDTVAASQHAAELAAGGGDPWWDYVAGYQSLLAGRVDDARLRLGRALGRHRGRISRTPGPGLPVPQPTYAPGSRRSSRSWAWCPCRTRRWRSTARSRCSRKARTRGCRRSPGSPGPSAWAWPAARRRLWPTSGPAGSAPASSRWWPAAWWSCGPTISTGRAGTWERRSTGPTGASRCGSARRWPSSATPSTGAVSSPTRSCTPSSPSGTQRRTSGSGTTRCCTG